MSHTVKDVNMFQVGSAMHARLATATYANAQPVCCHCWLCCASAASVWLPAASAAGPAPKGTALALALLLLLGLPPVLTCC